jgi:hypothetical protein
MREHSGDIVMYRTVIIIACDGTVSLSENGRKLDLEITLEVAQQY